MEILLCVWKDVEEGEEKMYWPENWLGLIIEKEWGLVIEKKAKTDNPMSLIKRIDM